MIPYLPVCQTVLSSNSGWIASPNHPNYYPDNANYCWLINATGSIVISFTQFALESNYDWVNVSIFIFIIFILVRYFLIHILNKIYDGPTNSSFLISRFSGSTIPLPVNSTSYQVLVTFTSDGSITNSGFNATFSVNIVKFSSYPDSTIIFTDYVLLCNVYSYVTIGYRNSHHVSSQQQHQQQHHHVSNP